MDAQRPNFPGGRSPDENVRRLQGRLRDVAKQQPGRRFHALYDRIYRSDVLYEAWNAVRRNRGSAGVDAQTIAEIEQYGVERFLEELRLVLQKNEYRPQAVLRRYIPKADGKQRPLGIPTVRDRIVQAAAKLILEPIFEIDFRDCSYGFRPGRSPTDALETLRREANRGGNHVLDADIRDFFGRSRSRAADLAGGASSDRSSGPQAGEAVGFDFLGCTLRKQFSGPVWMKSGKRLYFLQRCPSTRSMKRVRLRVKELTHRGRCHDDPRDVIAALNPVLRGWGQYFRTGNATDHFHDIDRYVAWRLKRLRVQRKGRHLQPGEARRWNPHYFYALGLHRLLGTVAYPEAT